MTSGDPVVSAALLQRVRAAAEQQFDAVFTWAVPVAPVPRVMQLNDGTEITWSKVLAVYRKLTEGDPR